MPGGQSLHFTNERVDHVRGRFAGHADEVQVPGGPLHERGDVTVLRPREQVAFPVPGNRAILDARGAFGNRDGVHDASA